MTDASQSSSRRGHRIALVSAVDPVLSGILALSLQGEDALVLEASLRPDEGEDGRIRLEAVGIPSDDDERAASLEVERSTDCWTCSLRELLAALAEDRARIDPDGATVVLLPVGIELVHLVPGLVRDLADVPGARLAGVAHLIDADSAAEHLLEHRPLDDGERCTGEVHVLALGYADLLVVTGSDPIGRDLVEHLRPHDTLLVDGLDAPVLDLLLSGEHNPEAALARVHPATTRAWGGPAEHGVRTLDLSSEMPFHPGRLREMVAELAGRGLVARGCFWLPSRPGRVCTWDVTGGVVSVGDAGRWEDAPVVRDLLALDDPASGGAGEPAPAAGEQRGPRCHLVVTGLDDDGECERVEAAFAAIILRPDEVAGALAWAGAPDGLEDWFGDEA